MSKDNKRNLYLKIRVSREELDAIDRKFQNSSMKSRSEFVRAMIFQGYIVNFDNVEFKQLNSIMRTIANNVNQIALRVNRTGNIYEKDIDEIKEGIDRIWQPLRYFQSQLQSISR